MPGINMNNAAPGLGRLALAMGGGPAGAYQKAYNNELGLQSRLAQAMAAIEASGATADLNRAKTESERAEQAMRTPEALRRTAMLNNGIPLDEAASVDSFLKTGHLSGKYDLDPTQQGPTMPTPDWVSKLGDVARAMSGTERALTIGDKSSENIAKAAAIERGERLSDSVINGTANRNTVAGAQAAAAGKDLFSTDATGSVLDRFTGNLATDNPMAGSTINLRKEQAGQAKAGAAENYAQASAANALTKQRNQITAAGPGAGKPPSGYRWATAPDGSARLEPIPGGPKDPAGGGTPKLTEDQGKATAWLVQATNSWNNMSKVLKESPESAEPGINDLIAPTMPNLANMMRGQKRQKYLQAASSLSESLLRAATGAGITRDEAVQKVAELTPQIGDGPEVIKQKMGAIPAFIQGLKVRAGPGAPAAERIVPLAAQDGPQRIASDAEYEALPSGAEFIAPDGSHRRKP